VKKTFTFHHRNCSPGDLPQWEISIGGMERCLHKLYSRRAAVLLFSCPTTSELKQPALETLTITSKLRIKLGVSECLWIYHSGRNVIHQPTKYFSDKFRRGSRILTFSENIFKKALVLAMFDYVWVSKNVKNMLP